MAYADSLRAATATNNTAASLIEGIFSSGFPATWSSYTPTLSPESPMTYTSTSITYAKYLQIGKLVICLVKFTGTTGGTQTTYVSFTLPVTAHASSIGAGAAAIVDNGLVYSGSIGISTTLAYPRFPTNGNFTAGSGRAVNALVVYEAA